MTSEGSAYGRLRRALDTRNSAFALAAAAELDYVGLSDALELVLLILDAEPNRFSRAALRWHSRYCDEMRVDLGTCPEHACAHWPRRCPATQESTASRS